MKHFTFLVFLTITIHCLAVNQIPDSIVEKYKALQNDSLRCEYLILKSTEVRGNFPRLSFELAGKALFFAEQSNYIQGMAKAYNLLGAIKCDIGEFLTAIEYHTKAYERAKFVNDNYLLAETYNYMGNVAYAQGKYTKAIEYYKESLKYSEKANSKNQSLNNLYRLGLIYETLDNLNDAYRCYKRSLLIEEGLKNKEGMFYSIMGIASVSAKKENYYQAFVLYNKALDLAKELNILSYQTLVYSKLGDLSKLQKRYVDALKYYSLALKIADSIDYYKDKKTCYYNLAYTNEKLQFYKDAYQYLSRYVALNDTLLNSEIAEQIARMQIKFDLKSKEKDIEKLKSLEEQRTKERNFFIAGSVLLFIILVLLVLLVRSRIKHTKAIKRQYEEIKSQKEELNTALEQLNELNLELKKINDQNIESLMYAASLQQILLPFEEQFNATFSQCFIFNKPKSMVSGDFAWLYTKNNWTYFAVADCTGHGLAGALVSIKASSLLSNAMLAIPNPSPSDLLNWLQKQWKTNHTKTPTASEDSVEIILCRFNPSTLELEYSAANQRFVRVEKNGNYQVLLDSELCIGSSLDENNVLFSTHHIQLQQEDMLYFFTDGFADQFGKSNQKLMFNSFLEHLRSLAKHPVEKQKEILADFFQSWKGHKKQTDDILVIGIKL